MGEEAKYNLVRLKVFFDVQGESELQGKLELGKQRLLESRCDIIFLRSILGKSSNPIHLLLLGCWLLQLPQCSCGSSRTKDGGESVEAQGRGQSPAAARGSPAGAGQGRPAGDEQAVGGAAQEEGQAGGVQVVGAVGKPAG